MRIEVFADSIERPIFKHPEYNADVLLAESTAVGAKTAGQNGTFIAHVLAGTGRLHYEINGIKFVFALHVCMCVLVYALVTCGFRSVIGLVSR